MSGETPQEDLSVEDILSSIKNILVEDPDAPQEEKTADFVLEQNITTQEPTDDIFNLDDSMVIDEPKEIPLNPIPAPEPETKQSAPEPQIPAPKEEALLNLADSIDIEQTLKMADDINLDNIPALANLNIAEEQTTTVKDETIDASANIINNFAKVFAEKRQEQNQSSQPKSENLEKIFASNIEAPNITALIEKTIIEQVKSNMNSHFEDIASKIIANQIREWLDTNLIAIVEKTVAKEIERVIAKVGS